MSATNGRAFALPSLVAVAALACTAACSGVDGVTIADSTCAATGSAGGAGTVRSLSLTEQTGAGLPDKTLSLTFDDGPAETTSELSEYLKSQKVAATFFINGAYAAGREDILKQQLADGHLLGNHTHTHRALTELSAAETVAEVEQTDRLLGKLAPNEVLFIRPPFGAWSQEVQGTLAKSTMKKYAGPIGWDVGAQLTETTAADWDCWDEGNGTRTVKECGDLYLKEIKAKRRGIVLMHDGPPESNSRTLEMIKYVLPLLKAEGYKFVRLDDAPLQSAATGATGETPNGTSPSAVADGCGTHAR